jgi:cytochrome c oxidase cbb3-type subunit 3
VLADDDWLYGGTPDKIIETLNQGRKGVMPSHAARLSEQEIADLATHVIAMADGSEHPPGKALFTGKGACFACHGMDAKGNPLLGSANLTDRIWRFAGTPEAVRQTITHGVNDASDPQTRDAVMPSFRETLSETEIKKLAVYVHRFGGGQ